MIGPSDQAKCAIIQGGRDAETQPSIRSLEARVIEESKPFARQHLRASLGREPTFEEVHARALEIASIRFGSPLRARDNAGDEPPDAR